jgi:hypothetical protein
MIEAGPIFFANNHGKMKMPDPMIAFTPMQNVSNIEIRRGLPAAGLRLAFKIRRRLMAHEQQSQCSARFFIS